MAVTEPTIGMKVLSRLVPPHAHVPANVVKQLDVALEGLILPPEPRKQGKVLNDLAAIVANSCGEKKFHRLARGRDLTSACKGISASIAIALHSDDQVAYLRFMARPKFNPRTLVATADLFMADRTVVFVDVPAAAQENALAVISTASGLGKRARTQYVRQSLLERSTLETGLCIYDDWICAVDKYFSHGPIRGYVLIDPSVLGDDVAGTASFYRLFLSSTSPQLVQHELQHIFDGVCRIGGERADVEYRAKVAAILFSGSLERLIHARQLYTELGRTVCTAIGIDVLEDRYPQHIAADERLAKEFAILFRMRKLLKAEDYQSALRLAAQELARKIFDREYRKACGLTYDQILEPFRKDPGLTNILD